MTRVRIQTVEDAGATGQVWVRDTVSTVGGAYAAIATLSAAGAVNQVAVFTSTTAISSTASLTFSSATLQVTNAGGGAADQSLMALVQNGGTGQYATFEYLNSGFPTNGLQTASQAKFVAQSGAVGGWLFNTLTASAPIVFAVGGIALIDERLRMNATAVIFNDSGGDVDFRVESAGNTHALFVDASVDNVGINVSAPLARLAVGGAIAAVPSTATLNSAGPTLTVGNSSYIRLTFGASASGNVVLSDGVHDGQILRLECVSYAGSATLPDSTVSNVRLSAAWTPGASDTLMLHWNGTDWIEDSRSANL